MNKLNKKMKIHLGLSIAFIFMTIAIFTSFIAFGVVMTVIIGLVFAGLWIWGVVNAIGINNMTGNSTFILISSVILPVGVLLIAVIMDMRNNQGILNQSNGENKTHLKDFEEVVVDPANKVYFERLKAIRQATIAGRIANKTSTLLNEGCKIISVTQYAHAFAFGRNKAATIYYTKPVSK